MQGPLSPPTDPLAEAELDLHAAGMPALNVELHGLEFSVAAIWSPS